MKKFKIVAFALGLLFCAATSAFAGADNGTKQQNPELRREVRAYAHQNILPVLRVQRLAFEQQLSAADRQRIARLRQEQQQLRHQAKELRESFKASRDGNKSPLTEAEKAQLKALREKQMLVVRRTTTIAERYRPQLQAIQAELADDKATWAADLRAIYAKYKPAGETDSASAGKHAHATRNALKLLRPVHFILWDVNRKGDGTEGAASQAYPNPSSGNTHITYSVAREGNVRITLLNSNGNSVRTLVNEKKAAGSYVLEADLSTLAKGVYYYKIETPGRTETKRLLKQ